MWQGLCAKTGFGKVHGWALADSRDTDVYISAMSPSTKGGLYYTKLKYKYRKVLFTGSTRGACTTLKYKPPSTDEYLSSSTYVQGLVQHSRRHVPRASKAQDAQIGCEVQICWQQSSPKYLLHYNLWSFLFCTAMYMMFFIMKSISYLLNINRAFCVSLRRPKSQRLNVFAKHFSSIQGPVEL